MTKTHSSIENLRIACVNAAMSSTDNPKMAHLRMVALLTAVNRAIAETGWEKQ